ncbi:MAG: serine O-acetyltransferase [Planctomycetota bacterium]|jgi:serine O-acetyltransferase
MVNEQRTELDTITHEILTSYEQHSRTERIGEDFLPSRQRIIDLIGDIRRLLFPGFFDHDKLTQENIKFHVGDLLARISQELGEQIYHCLCYSEHDDGEPCRRRADKLAREFLAGVPQIRDVLASDAEAAYDGDPAARSIDEIVYSYPGYYAVTVYRVAHRLLTLGVPLMPRIMTEHAHALTGTDIHPGATIGKRFFIDHATGVVIGETAVIGDNVKIYQGVTLGARSFPKDELGRAKRGLQRHPKIEDDVTIYANATILGGRTVVRKGAVIGGNATIFGPRVEIGAGAKIGSNTLISKSVEAGMTVMPNTPSLQLHPRSTS